MTFLNNWIFFDEKSTETTSNYLVNPSNISALTLQVNDLGGSEINLSVEGMNDLNKPDDYYPIKVICLEDFKAYSTITKAGIYMIPFAGIQRIRMISNSGVGTFKAYAIAID